MRTESSPHPRTRWRPYRIGGILGALSLALTAMLAGIAVPASAVVTPAQAATSAPPTLQDYWNGDADWTFVKKVTATQSGISSAFDGQQVRTTPDGTWYRFSRNWGAGDCQMSTEVRASSDQGETWSEPETVVAPEAGTAWSCNATDGGAYFNQDENRWYYLFQCSDGDGWAACVVTKDGADPRGGGWTPLTTEPVVSGGDLWSKICDDPTDDCVALSPGRTVYDEGTFDIFDYDGTHYWVAFHGYDGIFGYRGIAKTTDFRTWIAGDAAEGVPTDAIFDRLDSDKWRETWRGGSSIGMGHGSILEQDGQYYQIVEGADTNLGCSPGQRWDVGIYRTDDLSSTSWEPFPFTNPILYSSREPGWAGGGIPPCQIQYPTIFEDPTTGSVYLSYGRLDQSPDRNAVVWLKLDWKTNVLDNGNFWKASLDSFVTSPGAVWAAERLSSVTADTSPSLSVTPGAEPAVISQTVDVDPAWGSSVTASGKVLGDTTGTITVELAQLDTAGAVIAVDRSSVPAGTGWTDVTVPASVVGGAASIRYQVIFTGEGQVFRADDLHLGAAASAYYSAHRTETPIAIDGVAGEVAWDSAGAAVVSSESADVKAFGTRWGSVNSAADITSNFRVAWDETALYITEERKDDVLNFTESEEALYLSDAIMVFLDTGADKSGSSFLDGDYAILASASDPTGQPRIYLREGHDSGAFTTPLETATVSADIGEDGYTMEIAIPWSALSVTALTPAHATSYGFSLLATDNDGGGDWGQVMWSGNGDNQAGWGTLRLDGEAALPGAEEPGTEEPGTEEPGTEEPGTQEPGTQQPGVGGGPGRSGGSGASGPLAQTGAELGWSLTAGAAALLLIASGVIFARRRRG